MISNAPNTTLQAHIPPRTRLVIIGTQLALALTTGIPLLLSFLVPFNRLPQIGCMFYNITGLACPFCGFTRSIRAISAGDWVYATVNCPLAWLLYAALVSVFAWNAGCMLFGTQASKDGTFSPARVRANRVAGIIIALVLLNWIYRLSFGLT